LKSDVIKSLLSVSLVAMKLLASPLTNTPLALSFDIRDDESTSTNFDVLDDYILIVERVPMNSFRWLEELSLTHVLLHSRRPIN